MKRADEATRLVAILGYGCHLTPVLRRYLDGIAGTLDQLGCDGEACSLFFSGGFTMKRSAPGVSEARLMADYLREKHGIRCPAVLDQQARTTLENLRNLASHCQRRGIPARGVVICCDRVRHAKISYVASRLLGDTPRFALYDLERTPLERLSQQTAGLLYDALALRMPPMERVGLRWIDFRNFRS